jgi:phosphonoacetaldehyde hydrolase
MDEMIETVKASRVRAVITDWAGTIVDYGSLAPVTVVKEVYRLRGVTITDAEARAPMGRAKRDHLERVAAMPRVAGLWAAVHGHAPTDADIDALYAAFLPLQKQVLARMSHVIPGVVSTITQLRALGLKIGSTTGYTRELMAVVMTLAREEGLDIETVQTADDVPQGRPAPWMIFQAAGHLGVYPMWEVVTVDDTPVGIEAGRNAGAWAVGVARTGNGLGLPESAATALSPGQWREHRARIEAEFQRAGAHFVVDSFAELEDVIEEIDRRLAAGQRP